MADDVTDTDERRCAACGAVDPPGGLRLGPEGGGAEYEWFCLRTAACVERIASVSRRPTIKRGV